MTGQDLIYILSVPALVAVAVTMVLVGVTLQDRAFARQNGKHKRR